MIGIRKFLLFDFLHKFRESIDRYFPYVAITLGKLRLEGIESADQVGTIQSLAVTRIPSANTKSENFDRLFNGGRYLGRYRFYLYTDCPGFFNSPCIINYL